MEAGIPLPDYWTDPPWVVFLPGLSRDAAEKVLGLAESAGLSYGGVVLDPTQSFSLSLDRWTAKALYMALTDWPHESPAAAADRLDGVHVVIEDLQEFLELGD